MTPVYLNPLPTSTTKDHDHHDRFHLFMINSPTTQTPLSSSSTSTNHAHDPRQAHFTDADDQHNKVSKSNSKGGSSGSTHEPDQLFLAQGNPSIDVDEPARWMSCKVRSVHKTISSSSDGDGDGDDDHKASSMKMRQSPQDDHLQHSTNITHDHTNHFTNKNSTIIRVCSDCNTTTTPLWRSGPRGPKSLCNACGIRQRKARRAMAEAAAVAGSEPAPAPAIMRANSKEKKARTGGLVATMKKQAPEHSSSNPNKKLFFKDLALRLSNNSTFQRVFPRDEEEAAFLLMELSCGFAHT